MMGGVGVQYAPPPLKARANQSGMEDTNRPPVASPTPTLRRKKCPGRRSGEQRVPFVLEEEKGFQEENSPAAQLESLTTRLSTSTGVTQASEELLHTQGPPRKASAVKGRLDDPMDSDLSDYDNETSTCGELTCGPIGAQGDCHSVLRSPVGVQYSAAAAVREDEELETEVVIGRVSPASVDWIGVERGGARKRLALSPTLDESVIRFEARSTAPNQRRTCYGHQQELSDGSLRQSQVGLQRNHSHEHPPVDMLSALDGVISEKSELYPSAKKRSCDKNSSSVWPKNIPLNQTTHTEILAASPKSLSRSLEDILPILSPMFSSCLCTPRPGHCSPSPSGHNREDNSGVQQEGTRPVSDDVRPLMNESSECDSTVTHRIKDVQGNSTTKTNPGRKQIAHNLNPIVVAHLGQDRASLPFGYTADDISSTSQPQQWHKARGKKITGQPVSSVVVAKAKVNRKRKPIMSSYIHNKKELGTAVYGLLREMSDAPISYIADETAPEVEVGGRKYAVGCGLSHQSEADTPGDGEERTPGRLQAIWPPPRDEKVGLKYTEAEHQAALLQLKRECKEEEEKLQEDHGRALSRLREEHEENLALARLHAQRTLAEAPRRGDLRDACVSTEDDVSRKAFRTVCVQTDRETFLRAPEGGGGGSPQQQMAPPKRLDLASISLSLVGQREDHAPLDGPPRKPAIEPTVPMKPLYWTRIQIQDKKSDSLWDSLEPPSLINSGAFEDLFAKGTTQANRKPLAEAYEKKTKARKIVKLLDAKRSQAVGIFISSLHLDMKDIKHAVLKVDHSLVDLETIEALYENRAQPEEVQRIRSHYETADQEHIKLLDKPEQFLYELSQIPDFAGRARCIIFQSAFNDTIASVHHKVEMVSSACTALREGPGVRAVVAVVLALGNHMNGGSRVRGQADGFGLDILPKLKDVKSQDQRMSLVDYVVSYYLHYVDQDAGTDRSVFPLPEPQDLFLASQVRMDGLDRHLRRLGRDLTVCEKDVLTVSSASAEEHRQPFKDKMEAFLLTARKSHEEASDLLITSQKRFEAVVQYFGVRPRAGESEVSTAHFFLLWFEFCADFKTRWKKESKNVSKERLIEAQQSVRRITEDKKVEIRQVNPNSLKDRLRLRDRKASH
ncbi:unnamed protein product [Arctogadus glacialis]